MRHLPVHFHAILQLIAEQVEELLKTSYILPDLKNKNFVQFTTSNKPVECPINATSLESSLTAFQRRCKVCGTSIEHRRKDAVFCEKKQCRNSESNPRNNFKTQLGRCKRQTVLFNFEEVFKPTDRQRELLNQLNIFQ